MLYKSTYDAYMMIFLLWSFTIYFSIVFYPCAVSCTIEFAVLFYPDYRPWLPGTPFSALFPCFGAGVMGGRHIWYQSFG